MTKVVREKNKRKLLTQRTAMERAKTPFVNSHGMNAEQLRDKLLQTSSQLNERPGVLKIASTQQRPQQRKAISRNQTESNRRHKPDKAPKTSTEDSPRLLIDVPSVGTKLSVEYPTPDWFKYKGKAEVSVVVPLYKSAGVVKDLIDSWDVINDGIKVEVIFVDDSCPNSTKDVIAQYWQHRKHELPHGVGKLIFNTQNKGYGGACNTGAEYATGDYIIYLNADTTVTPGWVKPIVDAFKNDPAVGIVGNMQLKEGGTWHGTIDGAGSEWTWSSGSFTHIGRHSYERNMLPFPWKPSEAPADILQLGEREMVTGCCLAIRADLNRDMGGFNPNFRVGYWEDSDLCMSVREKGWKVVCEPNSVIYHKLGHTNSGAHEHHDFNRNYFWNKWVDSGRLDPLVKDKRYNKREIKSILLQRKGAHGDVLVASYLASALKKKYPGCRIGFYTKCPAVLRNNPHISKVFSEVTFSERQFQLVYNLDMVYEFRPWINVLQAYADMVGVKVEECEPYIAKEGFDGLPDEPYVVLHAGRTNWVGRDWNVNHFDEIAKRLLHLGKKVVCIGTEADRRTPCDIDLRGRTSITQLAGVISQAEAFVGIDSFPFHVAQAVGTKGACFFGSILPQTRIYQDNMKGVSVSDLPCIGCHHRKPRPSVVTNICETGTHDCVNNLSVDMFWSKIEEVLQ